MNIIQDINDDLSPFNQNSAKFKTYKANYNKLKNVMCSDILHQDDNLEELQNFKKHEEFQWFLDSAFCEIDDLQAIDIQESVYVKTCKDMFMKEFETTENFRIWLNVDRIECMIFQFENKLEFQKKKKKSIVERERSNDLSKFDIIKLNKSNIRKHLHSNDTHSFDQIKNSSKIEKFKKKFYKNNQNSTYSTRCKSFKQQQNLIWELYLEGKSYQDIASQLNIQNSRSVQQVLLRIKTGKVNPQKCNEPNFENVSEETMFEIKEWIMSESHICTNIKYWTVKLNTFYNWHKSQSAIHKLIVQLGFRQKKSVLRDNNLFLEINYFGLFYSILTIQRLQSQDQLLLSIDETGLHYYYTNNKSWVQNSEKFVEQGVSHPSKMNICAIISDEKLESIFVSDHSIVTLNQTEFLNQVIPKLRLQYGDRKICIIQDQQSGHFINKIDKILTANKILTVYLSSQSSFINQIERFNGILKNIWKTNLNYESLSKRQKLTRIIGIINQKHQISCQEISLKEQISQLKQLKEKILN